MAKSTERLPEIIRKDLDINEDDLDLEVQRQPSKYAYWGAQYARVARRAARQKLALKTLEAKIGRDFRNYMKKHEPQTRVTEGMVSTFVLLNEEHQTQSQRVIEAEYEENILTVARDAFRQRAQMLLQLARLKMDELIQSDFKINKRELEQRAQQLGGE